MYILVRVRVAKIMNDRFNYLAKWLLHWRSCMTGCDRCSSADSPPSPPPVNIPPGHPALGHVREVGCEGGGV